MSKIDDRIETIFSHAAALQQSGRLRNTIYCRGSFVYIFNQDHTVLIRFRIPATAIKFERPISFFANDYDSRHFTEKNGCICFIQTSSDNTDEYVREKSCRVPDFKTVDIRNLFRKYESKFKTSKDADVQISETFRDFLDENLSHIEFSGKDGKLAGVQRNIYTGAVTKIIQNKKQQSLLASESPLQNFKPIGVRTNDFIALFAFARSVRFWFGRKGTVRFCSKDPRMPFVGFLSKCMYDELGVDHG